MKTTFLIAILFGFTHIQSFDEPPVFCEFIYQMNRPCWISDRIEAQIDHWENGELRINYSEDQGRRVRHQYYPSGRLMFTCQVYQEFIHDTTFTEDPDTGELIMDVCAGYKDVPHGEYKQYGDYNRSEPNGMGNFINGIMSGEWIKLDRNMGLVSGTFNKEGFLDGPFKIYFIDGGYNRNKLKLSGQYQVMTYHYKGKDYDTGENIDKLTKSSERSGVWVEYDFSGDTLQTITYNWIKN